ncbi:hypothetical protein [Phaeocystidibacter luteus]|uniref:Outer membrane protein beta-barrel domain-containing protein n=1 Tax=Phaeocystidibacter luteus TaxID=911197 RepID=A0A6N6REY5_9FLAO|nr:hypothetical protein [Phaeocystidibacter luteus]KAB2805435.1 hypothetical protein F8C67_13350 [Phaeocystidibacter luteus]
MKLLKCSIPLLFLLSFSTKLYSQSKMKIDLGAPISIHESHLIEFAYSMKMSFSSYVFDKVRMGIGAGFINSQTITNGIVVGYNRTHMTSLFQVSYDLIQKNRFTLVAEYGIGASYTNAQLSRFSSEVETGFHMLNTFSLNLEYQFSNKWDGVLSTGYMLMSGEFEPDYNGSPAYYRVGNTQVGEYVQVVLGLQYTLM